MSSRKEEFWTPVLTSGLIIGGMLVVADLILSTLLGKNAGVLFTVVTILGIYYSQLYFRNNHRGGFIGYGEALRFGTFSMAAAGVLRGLYTAVIFKLKPEIWHEMILQAEELYYNMGVSDADIATMLEPVRGGVSPIIIVFSFVLGSMLSGLFYALITSIFIKRNNPNPFNDAMRDIE
ncbi:MAG: DUF4199 domain-containing protein [Mangrovibacterium sp.]